MIKKLTFFSAVLLLSCKDKTEKIKPELGPISESIYASGIIKSKNQYQAFASVNGIVSNVFVAEGDSVEIGDPILSISNEAQHLNKENAELAAAFADVHANQGKLNEAQLFIDLSRNKMKNDSALFFRQKNLWQQQIGSKVELEQKELAYQNSKTAYFSSLVKYNDLKRQLDYSANQSQKNLQISSKIEGDYTLKSEINGTVYSINKSKGEIVSPQTALAIIGDAKKFLLEMQVDEYDILKINKGLSVLLTLDSYKEKVFEAIVTRINPLMNERSKTFLVEAEFIQQPPVLYPNISFEANIVIHSKEKCLLVPRNYLIGDTLATKLNGEKIVVKTGLKDFKKIEILSGLTENDELIKPKE